MTQLPEKLTAFTTCVDALTREGDIQFVQVVRKEYLAMRDTVNAIRDYLKEREETETFDAHTARKLDKDVLETATP